LKSIFNEQQHKINYLISIDIIYEQDLKIIYIMNDPKLAYIPKIDFDWEYYLLKNPDVKQAGRTSLDKAYRHWTTYGCYENRWVKSLVNGIERQVKLKIGDKFPIIVTQCTQQPHIDLKFKIAIMIHIFDVTMIKFFASYINYLNNSYLNSNFDVYINIVEENNPFEGDLKQYVTEQLTHINNPNLHCYYNHNRGGDIGGFLILSKIYKFCFIESQIPCQTKKLNFSLIIRYVLTTPIIKSTKL